MFRKIFLFVFFTALTTTLFAGDFDRLKALEGKWEATTPQGNIAITFELISNGTAVMEKMESGKENMVTVYHPDGDSLLLTHYCSDNNQPRMRAGSSKDNKLTFSYVDASNLKGPQSGHMEGLEITFVDADHIIEKWNWKEPGKDHVGEFHLLRKK